MSTLWGIVQIDEVDLMPLELSTKIPEVKDVIEQVRELSADEKLRREKGGNQLFNCKINNKKLISVPKIGSI